MHARPINITNIISHSVIYLLNDAFKVYFSKVYNKHMSKCIYYAVPYIQLYTVKNNIIIFMHC